MEYICGMRLKGEENKGFILRGTNHQETELSKKMVNLDKKIFVKNIFLIQYKGVSAFGLLVETCCMYWLNNIFIFILGDALSCYIG